MSHRPSPAFLRRRKPWIGRSRLPGQLWCRSILLVGLFGGSAAGQGVDVGELELDAWSSARLGSTLTSLAGDLTGGQAILPQQLTLAFGLAEIATEVAPESPAAWRRLLDVATVLRNEVPEARAAAERAAGALVRLEPDDAVMRLRVLLDRINDRPTAEARIEAYQTLLEPENAERLGRVAAARLAFDLGVLQLRVGDLDAAARRIVDAVNDDPSFPQAAEMLAGMLRSASTTPVEEAELLAIAFTASPLDGVFARRLGQLALSEGAYASAADILDLALILTSADAPFLDELVADRAMALWGDGRSDEAFELLDKSHRSREVTIRRQMIAAGSDPDQVRVMDIPPVPSLALVRAAITGRSGSEADRDRMVDELFESFRFEMMRNARLAQMSSEDDRISQEQRNQRMAQMQARKLELTVDQIWARVWFGWTPPIVDGEPIAMSLSDLIDQAVAGGALSGTPRLVVDGWWAIHQDDFDSARTLLAPVAEGSPYAAAGLALLEELEGETKEAARLYLRTYRDVPGQLVGLWCRTRVADLLGRDIPAPTRSEEMARIIADTLPDAVGRALRDPRHGVLSVQVQPVRLRNIAFESVPVDITITNVSGLDLAIGPDGPILPTFILMTDAFDLPVASSQLAPGVQSLQPIPVVIPLDRRFRLKAQESMTIRVDLTTTPLGRLLDLQSYFSGSLRMRAVVNYAAAPRGAIDTGLFGREGRSPVFRIDGLHPLDETRAAAMIERLRDPRSVVAVKDLAAILGITMVGPASFPGSAPQAQGLAIDAFLGLPPRAQAWVMSVIPPGAAAPTRLVDALIEDEEVGLPLAIARFAITPTSSPIVRGLESTNPRTRRMAAAARDLAIRVEEAATRQFSLPGDPE
jgi:tetratricopeptide (TPR) repeat protein